MSIINKISLYFQCKKSERTRQRRKSKQNISALIHVSKKGVELSITIGFCLSVVLLVSGCKKFITIDPPRTILVDEAVFSSDATATAALTGIYSRMISDEAFASGGQSSVTSLTGLSADELQSFESGDVLQFFENSLQPNNGKVSLSLWGLAYSYIYAANAILEGLADAPAITAPTKQQLQGEARFIRAFCLFYLTNLFGDIPVPTTTDYQVNSIISQSTVDNVYSFLIDDLEAAKKLLTEDYSISNGERTRPNQSSASALLARAFLYRGEYMAAASEATNIIESDLYRLQDDPENVFLMNSEEAIWQLMPNIPGLNTWEGYFFIPTSFPLRALTEQLANSFEADDLRRTKWVDSLIVEGTTYYYPSKYNIQADPNVSEYSMVFRLAEIYLVRSEARAQLNDFDGALEDLNIIRQRAGLDSSIANDQASLLEAIEQERKVELFTEWGHRWLDLKRTGRADAVLGPVKGAAWQSTDALYPIPLDQIDKDPNIVQNDGY